MPFANIEERTLRVLLDQLPALVWTTDADLQVTAVAGEFARYEDLTPVGMTIYERWGPTTRSARSRATSARSPASPSSTRGRSTGTIEVDSEPGQGSAFTVRLPALDEAVRGAEGRPQPAPGSAGRVLLVEDEDLVRALVREVLERGGFSVLEAAGPAEALELARSDDPIDLLVTDLVLPGMSGTALVERITAERPGLRFLYTSGYVDETLRGAGHVLEKPFTPEDLLLKVHDLLR